MDLDFEKTIVEIEAKLQELATHADQDDASLTAKLNDLQKKCSAEKKSVYSNLTAWQTVQVARHPGRPTIRDYLAGIFTDFVELHGDRCFGDDKAIIGGFAKLDGRKVLVIGHQKGRTVEENLERNFGMARPEGYRKALRLMHLAEKYHIPIISFIDTPGAYPGADAEERGQAEAIARNLLDMSTIATPIIAVVTGEGGSGGAIGIGVGDVVLMLSNSVYSVISPEGCAAILWRDETKAAEAAQALKITAASLLKLGVIDEVVPEPWGGAHRDAEGTMKALKKALTKHLDRMKGRASKKLLADRFEKYAKIGKPR
jgi:acetyl-CoA carboxylase carboxyl transferase subunit alpha